MASTGRTWVAPTVVVLGVFALLGGAGFFHVLVVMTALWWLLTRTGSRGRHTASRVAPVQTTPIRQATVRPVPDAPYWPVLPAAAGAAAAWYATRETDQEPVVAAGDECEDDCADEPDVGSGAGWYEPAETDDPIPSPWGATGGGGAWGDGVDGDFGGSGGGGGWGDDFGGYGGGGGWDDGD